MARMHHRLKTETTYFQQVGAKKKRFEIRKNDRDFQVFDYVHLDEVVNGVPTGRTIGPLEIDFILNGPLYGLSDGYCIFTWSN